MVRDADRGLERVEAAALDRVARRRAVAAVADVPRPAPIARPLERGDGVAPPELVERAAVELDQVEVVGLEATQAPLDAGEQRRRAPVRAPPAASMAALGEEVELPPPGAERPPNEDLAVLVALGRVDHVQTGIQRAPEESRDRAAAHPLVADLGAAEAEHARDHIRLAEPALLHRCYYL